MASERTENDQETLSQRTIVRIAVGLLGLLTCTLIVFALKQTSRAGGLAERNQSNAGKVRQVVSSASVISAEDKTSGNNAADGAGIKTAADSLGCCRQKDFGSQKLVLNRVRLPHHRRTSYLPPQEQPSRTHSDAGPQVPKAKVGNRETTIVPKINVSTRRAWADGETPVVITISLFQAVKGNEPWPYRPRKEITFNLELEPHNATFTPSQIRILAGQKASETARLTAKQPTTVEIRCTPDDKYKGLTITHAQPEKVEFIAPIDRVGIEPTSGTAPVNTSTSFVVYLYNHSDTKTKLRPAGAVFVQLDSENGRGSVIEPVVQLTNQDFSKRVHYVGKVAGPDNITALAHYEERELDAKSERQIVFPWWTFLVGLMGTAVGSIARSLLRKPKRRFRYFIESSVSGLGFCIVIIFLLPVGTKFPEFSSYIQPSLLFGLGIMAESVLGGEILKKIFS